MIYFSFEPPGSGSSWRDTWDKACKVSPAAISEIDLCYKYFGVHVELVVDGVEVISGQGYLTLVDLALSLRHALNRLSSGEDSAIGFTENDEVIRLRREENRVVITSSKHDWRVSADHEELVGVFAEFLREAHSCLIEFIPGLAVNPVIRGFSPE
ncbi:hypothetical protein RI578_42455 (plasmid) [Streptomyces sp. BB1-1-1]|uniref:hypothetical protein n=1 Tax=Streptomyces sp. BB1-1-1 TaxID=3074430 RepID=UPI002877D519|nr:hypothetical protein [Streptomyces sp. BB1-1-1]WND32827.1 hypothetical protein RI578_00175 [Streptomyces sp. BB1-1-1]WND40105.1 hypothetical protein RI578_40230 [Streptomyces sp. BB1-1-1]WND40937.1 hypothetical protein RI578_42455 [Streptomyces sp. BB1-1-1]